MSDNLIPGMVASGDLSSSQFRFVRLSTSSPFEVSAISNANAPQIPIGVMLNDPDAAGKAAEVAGPGSVVKAEAGGSFDEAVTLGVDDVGRVIAAPFETSPATADLYIIGTSVQASGGSGEIVFILVQSPVLASTE